LIITTKKAIQKVIESQQHQHHLIACYKSAITEVGQKFCQNFVVGV
jgi:hypothetical protein